MRTKEEYYEKEQTPIEHRHYVRERDKQEK